MGRAEHPLLGAVTDLADQDQVVITARLSTTTQDWLTGHQVTNTIVFPATGFLEVLLRAGELVGCPLINEMVLHTPLALTQDAATDLQIVTGAADQDGHRAASVHARPAAGHQDGSGWVLHANATLSAHQPLAPTPPPAPSPGGEAIDPDDFYQHLDEQGYHYSGLFRSLRAMGQDPTQPEVVFAEVGLPAGTDVTGYGIHPALLDAALHPLAALTQPTDQTDTTRPRLPFAMSGITLHATAATGLHVHLAQTGEDSYTLLATDPTGAPVISIDTITVRALPDTLTPTRVGATANNSVLELSWPPLPKDHFLTTTAPTSGWVLVTELDQTQPAATELVVWALPHTHTHTAYPHRHRHRHRHRTGVGVDGLGWVHALTAQVLAGLQDWLARPETTDTQLVVLTRHAVTTGAYDRAPDLAHAAVWALAHTAANEHPGRIRLIDTDDTTATSDILIGVLAALADPDRPVGEPQLALRHGTVHIPRLMRTQALTVPDSPSWQLASTGKGDLAHLALLPTDPPATLGPGQIRVAVRAAGLNFHDVVVALGAISDEGLGAEAAGIVIDTAADVTTVAPGDAVMGLFPHNAFAPTATTEASMVVAIPTGWSYNTAASVPVAFLTAYHALIEIGGLRPASGC